MSGFNWRRRRSPEYQRGGPAVYKLSSLERLQIAVAHVRRKREAERRALARPSRFP